MQMTHKTIIVSTGTIVCCFRLKFANILYTTPICFVHFNKERSCPCCSLAPPAPLCRRVGSLRPAASKQVLFPYLDIYRCTALSKPSSHQMTLVFRRGSAYDKDKIAGLQLYTAHLTGRKRYVYTARRKLLFPPRLALFAGRCLPHAKAIDAHRDAEGHAFYEADYREPTGSPSRCPTPSMMRICSVTAFRTAAAASAAPQRSTATSSPFRRGTKTTRCCLRLRGCARPATSM